MNRWLYFFKSATSAHKLGALCLIVVLGSTLYIKGIVIRGPAYDCHGKAIKLSQVFMPKANAATAPPGTPTPTPVSPTPFPTPPPPPTPTPPDPDFSSYDASFRFCNISAHTPR